jgi:hypothetical protein
MVTVLLLCLAAPAINTLWQSPATVVAEKSQHRIPSGAGGANHGFWSWQGHSKQHEQFTIAPGFQNWIVGIWGVFVLLRILRGPDLEEWDFSIVKDTAVPLFGKQGSIQFRTEIFNILNHTNLGMPASATVFNGATSDLGEYQQAPIAGVGQITTTSTTSRQIQFALKLIF